MTRGLDLHRNNLEWPIPKPILQLRGLSFLGLSRNRFSSTLLLNETLCGNRFSSTLGLNEILFPVKNFMLALAFCDFDDLLEFLKTQVQLGFLDLSDKYVQGIVPRWIWNLSENMMFLNLPCNDFIEPKQPIPPILLKVLDLKGHCFKGTVPDCLIVRAQNQVVLNAVRNNLSGIIPNILKRHIVATTFKCKDFELPKILRIFTSINLSSNAFHGEILKGLGSLNALIILNLSHDSSFNSPSRRGNKGLHDPPLKPTSRSKHAPGLIPPHFPEESTCTSKSEVELMMRGAEVGFPVGLTIFIRPFLFHAFLSFRIFQLQNRCCMGH
ncbi:hypothetical protein Cgig2_000153 [Carnegiea gigantea]|uniref:Uncharacterized protein n=1 Tax=Carnegiea gigantea TaxID=171969 RepID=A0A9Q1Q658_9CARY|nr:hypothetical protein Cgig2_000153 [Carnegiea gigantea]